MGQSCLLGSLENAGFELANCLPRASRFLLMTKKGALDPSNYLSLPRGHNIATSLSVRGLSNTRLAQSSNVTSLWNLLQVKVLFCLGTKEHIPHA